MSTATTAAPEKYTGQLAAKLRMIETVSARPWGVAWSTMLTPRQRNLERFRSALFLLHGQEELRAEFASELIAAVVESAEPEA